MRTGLHLRPIYPDYGVASAPSNVENVPPLPIPAVRANHTHPTQQKRFKSSLELARTRKRAAPSMAPGIKPASMTPLVNTGKRHKTCSLCYQQGHTVRHCPSIEHYKGLPLAKDDRESRSELSMSLAQPYLFTTRARTSTDKPKKSLPTGVQALIIHQRQFIEMTIPNNTSPDNFCLECTILHNGGMEHEQYTKTSFQIGCIAKFVTNNKQNIVISELRPSAACAVQLPVHNVGFLNPYLSQASHTSQGFSEFSQNNNDVGGYSYL